MFILRKLGLNSCLKRQEKSLNKGRTIHIFPIEKGKQESKKLIFQGNVMYLVQRHTIRRALLFKTDQTTYTRANGHKQVNCLGFFCSTTGWGALTVRLTK